MAKKEQHLVVNTGDLAQRLYNEVEGRDLDYQIDKEKGKYRIQIDHNVLHENGEERTYPSLGQALAAGFLILLRMDHGHIPDEKK